MRLLSASLSPSSASWASLFCFCSINASSEFPCASTAGSRQGKSTRSARASSPPPAMPPGLVPPPGLSVMRSTPQSGAYSRFGAGQVPSRRGPRTDALVRAQACDYTEGDEPRRSTAEALADMFDNAPSAASVRSGGRPCCVDEGADTDPAIPVRDQSRADCEVAIKESTWDGYDGPRSDAQIRVRKRGEEEWICPEHGPTCTPSICEARGRVERAMSIGRKSGRRDRMREGSGKRRGRRGCRRLQARAGGMTPRTLKV